MHVNGQGGPVSMEQARVWYGRAAEQGHALAQCSLALMHREGHGGPVSREHAIFWLKLRAGNNMTDLVLDQEVIMHIFQDEIQDMESACFSRGKRRASGELNMKKCVGCKCAIYCSKGCQRAHWKKNGGHHKTMCKKPPLLEGWRCRF